MPVVAIAFGSNLGDRTGQIERAIAMLREQIAILRVSPLYETAPMYVTDQPAFVNGALLAETSMGPLALLRLLKRCEAEIGRLPRERNGPREIDLDLIRYGELQLTSEFGETSLRLPHPRLHERRFVLQPLHDLDPSMQIPGLGVVESLLAATESQAASVRRVNDASVSIPIH